LVVGDRDDGGHRPAGRTAQGCDHRAADRTVDDVAAELDRAQNRGALVGDGPLGGGDELVAVVAAPAVQCEDLVLVDQREAGGTDQGP
jgi:hypothetical protein